MFSTRSYTHNGLIFSFEADGWSDEFSARAAIKHLRSWLVKLSIADTTALFVALMKESVAIAREEGFNHECDPYPAVRRAQHRAAAAGKLGRIFAGDYPSVTIEACEVATS